MSQGWDRHSRHTPLHRVRNRQAHVATTPPLGITVLSHFKLRDKPRQRVCNKPRVSYFCNRGLLARAFGHTVSTHSHMSAWKGKGKLSCNQHEGHKPSPPSHLCLAGNDGMCYGHNSGGYIENRLYCALLSSLCSQTIW